MDWNELRYELIQRMNVREVYESLGVRFTSDTPSTSGWLSCHAVGREDRSPSAAVNVESGYYRDLGHDGDALSIWDALAKFGPFATWLDAFRYHAKVQGLGPRLPKERQQQPADKLDFINEWNPLAIRGLLEAYPQFTEWAIRATGGVLARYPKRSKRPRMTVNWPVYGPQLLNAPPVGWVSQACDGGQLELFQGKDADGNNVPPKLITRLSVGGSQAGLVGRYAVGRLMQTAPEQQPDLIIKVEGLSDLVALQAAIPTEQRDRVLVLTNSAGCMDSKTPTDTAPLFAGRNLVILHDSDRPGQSGAELWLGIVGPHTKQIRNVVLHPDDISETHGRDLRDWLEAGHTFDDLMQLIEQTPPVSSSAQAEPVAHSEQQYQAEQGGTQESFSPYRVLLQRLGIVVLGHIGTTNKVSFFTERDGRCWEIRDLSRYRLEELIMHLGHETVDELVNTTKEPDPSKVSMTQIRRAIAAEANRRRITDEKKLGEGCWLVSSKLALVGAGETLFWDGSLTATKTPFCDEQVFDFPEEPWFDAAWMKEQLRKAESDQWCVDQLNEAVTLFNRWDNWKHPDTATVLAGLVCCTWIQTVWPIRPLVSISGPSNSGKSMFLDCLKAMFGNLALSVAKPSEAGLRQYIGHTARVLIVDEFEADRHRLPILELFRTSSRGQEVIRGTANQQGTRFGLRHIPWVGAIELGLTEAADANRFIRFELHRRPAGAASKLVVPPRPELTDLGLRLLVVAMRKYRKAMQFLHPLRSQRWASHDSRLVEIYSVPAAMIAAITGLDQTEAAELLELMLEYRREDTSVESDEAALVEEIYNADVPVGKGSERETVGTLISGSMDFGGKAALERHGISVSRSGDDRFVFIAPRTVRRKLLRNTTTGERDIGQILTRITGARRTRERLNGTHSRGIQIPMTSINNLFGTPCS